MKEALSPGPSPSDIASSRSCKMFKSILRKGNAFRYFGASMLLVAWGLKTGELIYDARIGVLHGSRWLHLALANVEVLLGIWLLIGIRPKWCRAASLAMFAGFTCYTLYLVVTGATSCGCFGRVHVNPWLTLALDALLAVAAWHWRPSDFLGDTLSMPRWQRRKMLGATLGLAGICATTVLTTRLQSARSKSADGIEHGA